MLDASGHRNQGLEQQPACRCVKAKDRCRACGYYSGVKDKLRAISRVWFCATRFGLVISQTTLRPGGRIAALVSARLAKGKVLI